MRLSSSVSARNALVVRIRIAAITPLESVLFANFILLEDGSYCCVFNFVEATGNLLGYQFAELSSWYLITSNWNLSMKNPAARGRAAGPKQLLT